MTISVLPKPEETRYASPGDGKWLAAFGRAAPAVGENGNGDWPCLRLLGDLHAGALASATVGSIQVVFDGVLYNRGELNRDLTGVRSDANNAEVLCHVYQHWGEDFLGRLRGVFALLLWDGDREVLLAARDALGLYPLFYADTGRELLFSTTSDALVQQPGVSARVNRTVLAEMLCHHWNSAPEETFHAGVRRVLPGHVLRVDRTGTLLHRYWDPIPVGQPIRWLEEDEVEQFDHLLDQAVRRCLEQGRAGIFLSGGLDSVTIATRAADTCRHLGLPPLQAFSLAFPDDLNETVIQRRVAADLGFPQLLLRLEETTGGGDLLPLTLAMSARWPAPLTNYWRPAYHFLKLEALRRGCRVILTGDGGDEWLTVTDSYGADLLRAFQLRGACEFWGTFYRSYQLPPLPLARILFWHRGLRLLMGGMTRRLLRSTMPDLLQLRYRRRIDQGIRTWLAPEPALHREIEQRALACLPRQEPESFYVGDLRQALHNHETTLVMEEVFEHSRQVGLRVLHPFWDQDVVDLLVRMRPEQLNGGGRSKGLVRRWVARRFPQLGFEQQKKRSGYKYLRAMFRREGAHAWKAMGGAPALADLGIIDADSMRRLASQMLSGPRRSMANRLVEYLSAEAWLRPRV